MNQGSMPTTCVMAMLALSACSIDQPISPAPDPMGQPANPAPDPMGQPTNPMPDPMGCDTITCSNSPDTILFGGDSALHQLNLSGGGSGDKFRLITSNGHAQITKGNDSYDLYVKQGRLIGTAGTGMIQAADLIGTDIPVLYRHRGGLGVILTLHIDSVRWFAMPFGQNGTVESYRITTNIFNPPTIVDGDPPPPLDDPAPPPDDPPGPLPPLCGTDNDDDAAHDTSFPNMEPGEVLAFEGDQFDVIHKTMNAEPDLDWFNFGCAGSAAAKLYLMGETVATQPHPLDNASWQERQAMLKMLVADYCGTGRSFTVHGEPLIWQGGRISYALSPKSLEARWNANGATCLGTPRLEVHPEPDFGSSSDLMTAIAAECGEHILPECPNTDPKNYDGAVVVSANRP